MAASDPLSTRRHPYPKYKPSGVEWLGDVPEHWEVKRLDFLASVKARLGWKGLTASEYVPEGFIFLATPNIKGEGEIDFTNVNYITAERYYESPEIMVQVGDVLMAKDGSTLGTTNVVHHLPAPTTVNSSVGVLRPKPALNSSYFFRWLTSGYLQSLIQSMKDGQGVPHLFQADIRKFPVLLPPPSEQRAIAAFLDRETGRVDRLVAKKRELIERLKEKRTAMISRTVTRGLPAETAAKAGLPVNPPLKPSGLDWLGDIPKHWEVKRLSYLAMLKSGENITSEMIAEGGEYPVYGGNGLRGFYHKFTHRGHFVLIGRQGALCGNINFGNGEFWASEHAVVVLPLTKFAVGWMGELLRAMNLGQYSVTAAQPGIAAEVIRGLQIPVPPLPEQASIAAYLDEETAKLDALVAKVEEAIERLQEYRTALITAAVTGKIDIR